MNVILFESSEIDGCLVQLEGRRADHIVKVLRACIGDMIKIGIINGKIGHGTIKEINCLRSCVVTVKIDRLEEVPPETKIDILLALPRPIMLKRILSHVAALGVGRVHLVNSQRVEKSFWDASLLVEQRWREHFLTGLEQAVDTMMPSLTMHRGFKPFVELELPALASRYQQLLLAHPAAGRSLPDVFTRGGGRVLLAVGPEGGWSEYEVDSLIQAGFTPFSIGPRILRVETAVTVLHAMVDLLMQQYCCPVPPIAS